MKLVIRLIEASNAHKSMAQVRDDISDALKNCEKMIRYCEDCKTMFSELNNELLAVRFLMFNLMDKTNSFWFNRFNRTSKKI